MLQPNFTRRKHWNFKLIVLILIIINSIFWFQYLQKRNTTIIWKRNIFADASGYFVYLPSAFIYHFNANEFAKKFENRINEKGEVEEVGCGFKITNNKIVTKYFYGIALLQAPAYILIHLGYKLFGIDGDGFNGLYEHATIISTIIYYILSLLLLFKLLKQKTNELIALTAILFTVFGTNVIYYFAGNPGYTHAYLFFLFSAFLYSSYQFSKTESFKSSISIYAIAGLIIVIRPIHLIFLLTFFIENNFSKAIKLLNPRYILTGIGIIALIIFPQLLYYKYLSGNWLYYSYGGETFTNILNPSLIKFYFSTNNGLFIYNPIWLIFLFSAFFLLFTKYRRVAIISISLFFVNSYLCASWHIWSFGCGYGSRNFVEYAALFSVVYAYILQAIQSQRKIFIIIALSFFLTCINFVFMFHFDKCYFGKGDWDWEFVKKEYLCIKR